MGNAGGPALLILSLLAMTTLYIAVRCFANSVIVTDCALSGTSVVERFLGENSTTRFNAKASKVYPASLRLIWLLHVKTEICTV